MFQTGCVALVMAAQTLCFTGGTITCSDQAITGIPTCRFLAKVNAHAWRECVKAKACSPDGSTSSTFTPKR